MSTSRRRTPLLKADGDSVFSRRLDLFAYLPENVQRDFVAAATRRIVPGGSVVYSQTDLVAAMFRIVSGEVTLSRVRADGRELLLYVMPRGDCFGIGTLIDGEGQPHMATARTDVELQVLDRRSFEAMRRTHTEFNDALLRLLCRDVRELSEELTDLALDDLPARLAHRLLEMAGRSPHNGAVIQLSQAELALMSGASRQSVNKLLKQFQDQGLVHLAYGAIRLDDVAGLIARTEPSDDDE